MEYTKIQKFISSFVLFSLLFGITFRVPFFNYSTYAGSSDFFNLVSIIVDEDSYDDISSELKRYAEDIQGVLENTKVVILPTPKNADAFKIASLNESLYFDGYKSIDNSVDFESKLIGTVLVGEFNLPIVYEETESSKTILPFTDFEDKVYIYNHESKKYEKNDKGSGVIKSEIWHGVISPNLGDFDENIQGLKDYFDKNHDYYTGAGNFQLSEGILNGNKNVGIPSNYEPYVFYNDQFREKKSLSYNSFKAYEGYLENLEDIVYNRFSQELADKLTNKTLGDANNSILSRAQIISDLNKELGENSPFKGFDDDFVATLAGAGPETQNVPDIQTRLIVENATKKFIEIFSKGTLGEFRKDVYNAGRYNKLGSDVNVDMIPSLISVLDAVYSELLKDVSNELENEIDKLVKNGLSINIAIPTKIIEKNGCDKIYENYLYGKKGDDIKSASDCSIYRGSTENGGKLVEANRGLNINLITDDKKKIDEEPEPDKTNICYAKLSTGESFNGWWGGNSPMNITVNASVEGMMELKTHDLNGSITPIFDIGGSKEIFDSSKIPSPLNCYDNNFILAEDNLFSCSGGEASCENIYKLPTYGDRKNWTCENDNNSNLLSYSNTNSFQDNYTYLPVGPCEKNDIILDGNVAKSYENKQGCASALITSTDLVEAEEGTTTCILIVDGEEGNYVGNTNGNRPTFRFDKTGGDYCSGGSCVITASCDDGDHIYNIPVSSERYVEGQFVWKPASESDGKLVVLLSNSLGDGVGQESSTGEECSFEDDTPSEKGSTTCVMTVDGETGDFVGNTNGNRPTFRFNKTGGDYCGGGACTVTASCDDGEHIYNIPLSSERYVEGQFVWKPTSESNGNLVVLLSNSLGDGVGQASEDIKIRNGTDYYYKQIPSYVIHKSPDEYELKEQIKVMTTPSLPVDKVRYIDFISPAGNLVRIDYPYLFGLKDSLTDKVTLESVTLGIDKLLNEKSEEINGIISTNNPHNLTGNDAIINNLLKTGEYPSANIDLLKSIKEKVSNTLSAVGGTEEMTFYDTLAFSLYWQSLKTVSAKYAFVFDYYLNDQSDSEEQKYFLPKNKKQYEISYLGAKGDSKNMYIKMDPEGKADNVYTDLISNNIKLSSSLLASNIGSGKSGGGSGASGSSASLSGDVTDEEEPALFSCSPPDGVPIREWMPAIMCRLGEMLPPTISFSDGNCGASLLENDDNYYGGGDSGGENLGYEDGENGGEDEGDTVVCEGDSNKNGINDCIEQELGDGGILELSSDSEKYYFNTNATLKAIIKDKNGKIVKSANGTYINFELHKIEEAKDDTKEFTSSNIKVAYDINDTENNNKSVISKYVNFNDTKIISNAGVSNYLIGSKLKEVNLYLKAYIKINDNLNTETIFLETEPLKIEVRGNRLFNSTYKFEEKGDGKNGFDIYNGINSLKVSDKNNIILVDGTDKRINDVSNTIANSTNKEKIAIFIENKSIFGKNMPISYPLNVTLLEGEKEIDKLTVTKADLNIFKSIFSIKKSGSYTVEIIDSEGYKTTKNIELIPEIPNIAEIQLGTTVMQTGGNVSTNFITIYDEYSNLTTGEYYDIDITVDGNGVEFLDNNSNNLKTTTFEGYKIFRLKSTNKEGNNKINVKISDTNGSKLIESSKNIEVLEKINLVVIPKSSDIKVGGGIYKYELSLRNKNGVIINNFNSRAYLTANPIFLEAINPYVNLENGVAEIEFKTKTVAGQNIPIEFQVEGLAQIIKRELTISPDLPMKIDLILSQNEIEASETEYSILNVELKDRYNNLVFNDNSTNTSLEILEQYSHIITSDKINNKVKEGKTSYKIFGTLNPGVAHFKISTDPSLGINSFVIEDVKGNLTINGVGENSGKIETYYFWNKSKIEGKKYNSMYTTLLGANYGDITEQDYLAGSLLFERDNRALAVTSLLTNPYKYSNILKLDQNGLIKTINTAQDLSQDIVINTKFINNKLALDIYNKSLNIYVGDIFYNFKDNTKLIACELGLEECINKNETSINLKSFSDDYDVYLDGDKLILRKTNGENLIEIGNDGTISRLGAVDFEFDDSNEMSNLLINIKKGGQTIAKLSFNFIDAITNVSRDINIFNAKINSVKNSILVLIKTNSYGTYNYGNLEDSSKIFYYNDPFGSENALNSFTKNNIYGYENFLKEGGIGWNGSNKSLLAFAAGKTVGESVQDYMSFSVINLGDPVISLKKIKKKLSTTSSINRKFDATIGKLLSKDSDISGYHIFDYDNDSLDDILLVKKDNYFKLLENKNIEGRFLDKGNLAYIVDLGATDLVGTGDFTGDGFDDIFFVNKEGDPHLLNNVNKNFTRYSLIESFNLDGRILIAKVFDMDNDGVDDIVTLDDSGEINIFYGKGNSTKPSFTKLTISEDNGVTLNTDVRNDNSLIYFNGLYQPTEDPSENIQINNLLYIKYPYSKTETDITYEKVLNGEEQVENDKPSIYFLKSEYSESTGLKVEKSFTDKNGGFISSSDIVEAKIVLTNVSNKKLSDVIFLEKLPETFLLDQKSIKSDKDFDIKKGISGYKFLIDGFDLTINESITITYGAKVKSIKYGYIDVGLFEKGEIGDDKYGDIIIKKDNKNCGDTVDIFRSLETVSSRSYEKGVITPTCDADKTKMPDELTQNTIDVDGNGVPDYIDELTNTEDTTALQEYGQQELDKLNGDNDDVGSITDEITEALESVNDYITGLSCGFGGAGCISMPLNWAPLAPGNDLVFQGRLIGDGLNIDEGLPIFSALTWMQYGPYCGPTVWPISPLSEGCSDTGAGGVLGIDSPTNVLRIFVTPTLTGGVGTAICFGGPASVAGNSPPQGVSPLAAGGNCIVLAKKFDWCGGDGSDGDPSSVGIPTYSVNGGGGGGGNGNFGVINGNCDTTQIGNSVLSTDVAEKYLGGAGGGSSEEFNFTPEMIGESLNESLFVESDGSNSSVSIDFASSENGNFEDIEEISQTRISSFPSFLMDWVTRQIEEIANKLTDFPTIFIILPDFSGIFDLDWGKTSGNDVISGNDSTYVDNNLTSNEKINTKVKKVNSGIKEAYEFIGSIPLVYIEQETVNITIPWISLAEINKTITSWESTISQRGDELEKAKNAWSLGTACSYDNPIKQEQCEIDNKASKKVSFELLSNIDSLIGALNTNLEVLKSYKKIPEQINKLINTKQTYLEQILCNVESISYILGGRIGKNGERFKAWVEVYILIKSILKTWQALVDVFIDYEEECHDCKNERQDSLDEEFSWISMIIPKIPIIRFPKWPDIIIDLHNIRAGLRLPLPEFDINTKPIIIPTLPALFLPDVPNINTSVDFKLPEIPLLPKIIIPDLPLLPSLPSVELPDLPPPPKLPEILSEISVVLEIIKLISEAMCILKSSPLHPEWRAGDQIAFLTERGGYMPTDFLNISIPEFSFPSVDAIKVSTFVNLEFETKFIVELARQIAMPLNHFSNDFVNIFDIKSANLDFDTNVPIPVSINEEFGYNNSDKLGFTFASRVASNISHLFSVINERKNDEVDSYSFKQLVNKSLASKTITSNPKLDKVRAAWMDVNNISYSKENTLIKELKDNNKEKFQAVSDIINTEIIKNKELKEKINNIGKGPNITKVSYNDTNKVSLYNKTLSVYNDKFKESAKKLVNSEADNNKELKESKDLLLSSIKTPLQKYSEGIITKSDEKLLAAVSTTTTTKQTTATTSCQAQSQSDSDYKFKYEGIYILEGDTSYRLFDYLDELDGNETTKIIDIDKDNDDDLLYFANGQLFLKENLQEKQPKLYVTTSPLVITANNNKFYNNSVFYEAINNAHEIGSPNGKINLTFSSPTNKVINNFRIGFYTIVDKYLNENDDNYRPEFIKKDIIDAIAGIDEVTKIEENSLFIKRKNLSYIDKVGMLKDLKLKTKELINIKDDLSQDLVVNILKGTTLYAGGNSFDIDYIEGNDIKEKSLKVSAYENIELQKNIKVIGISGNAYIEGSNEIIYKGMEIIKYLNKPLFPGSVISYIGTEDISMNQSYVELKYYDNSELNLDFDITKSWELFDLGNSASDYYVIVDRDNDYYYTKINSFSNNIDSTLSNQILLAPQLESDQTPPDLSLNSIRVPVYQKHIENLTSYIYEYGGVKNIKKVIVDLDLENDTDGNGNSKDDNDGELEGIYKDKVKILHSLISLKLEFGEFDTLFKKKIGITLIDLNNNVGYKEISLEVYSPIPEIIDVNNGLIEGSINESLSNEPINIYRYRGGSIKKLENTEGLTKTLTIDGNYLFNIGSKGAGLSLNKDGSEIALIDEITGKITFKDLALTTKILSSNNDENDKPFPKIIVQNDAKNIFYEYIQVKGVSKVTVVDNFNNLEKKGIYFTLTDKTNYNYYTIPETLDYAPGSVSAYRLTDSSKAGLFTIFKDGRIITLNDFYKLEYSNYDNYIVIKITDTHFNREIGRVLFLIEGEYIMK